MVAGRPVSVQSPARNRLRQRGLGAGGRLASWAGVAAKVARFSLTICQGGRSSVDAAAPRRHRPRAARASSSRSWSTMASAPRHRHRDAVLETRISIPPCRRSRPASAARPAGGAMRKWALTMARNSVGRGRDRGTSSCATQGGTARITASLRVDRHGGVGKFQRQRPLRSPNTMRAQPLAQVAPRRPSGFQKGQRRIDEGRGQSGVGDARAAGAAARGQGLAHHRAGQLRGACLRLGVQRRQQEGPHQPVPQRALASAPHRRCVALRPANSSLA